MERLISRSISGRTSRAASALSAIDAATPGLAATRCRGAFGAAVQALDGLRGTIIVVSDLQKAAGTAAIGLALMIAAPALEGVLAARTV